MENDWGLGRRGYIPQLDSLEPRSE